jgi:hypothetical protein
MRSRKEVIRDFVQKWLDKAYLVRHQIEFRKTHDLDLLLRLASQAEPSLREELASCKC